jgi:hypothetical protein
MWHPFLYLEINKLQNLTPYDTLSMTPLSEPHTSIDVADKKKNVSIPVVSDMLLYLHIILIISSETSSHYGKFLQS